MNFYETLIEYWLKRIEQPDTTKEELDECKVFIRHLTHYLIIQQGG